MISFIDKFLNNEAYVEQPRKPIASNVLKGNLYSKKLQVLQP